MHKVVRISVLNNGTVTLWKHELAVSCTHVSGRAEVWDWVKFTEGFCGKKGAKRIIAACGGANKVTFAPLSGETTAELITALKTELRNFLADEPGDEFSSGVDVLECKILKTVSTKQTHVMFA